MFYIVSAKCTKCCIVPHIVVQMSLPVDGVYMNLFNQNKTHLRDWLQNMNREPTCQTKQHFDGETE